MSKSFDKKKEQSKENICELSKNVKSMSLNQKRDGENTASSLPKKTSADSKLKNYNINNGRIEDSNKHESEAPVQDSPSKISSPSLKLPLDRELYYTRVRYSIDKIIDTKIATAVFHGNNINVNRLFHSLRQRSQSFQSQHFIRLIQQIMSSINELNEFFEYIDYDNLIKIVNELKEEEEKQELQKKKMPNSFDSHKKTLEYFETKYEKNLDELLHLEHDFALLDQYVNIAQSIENELLAKESSATYL